VWSFTSILLYDFIVWCLSTGTALPCLLKLINVSYENGAVHYNRSTKIFLTISADSRIPPSATAVPAESRQII